MRISRMKEHSGRVPSNRLWLKTAERNSSDYGSVIDQWGLNIAIFNRLFIRIFIKNSGPTDLCHRVSRMNRCTAFELAEMMDAIVGISGNGTVSSQEIRIFTKFIFRLWEDLARFYPFCK